jgi:hypothetical protein
VRARFIQNVDGLVGTGALRHEAIGEHDRRFQGIVRDRDGVVPLERAGAPRALPTSGSRPAPRS